MLSTALTDPDTLTQYRDELRVGAFLSRLKPKLAHMIHGQVLVGSCVMLIDEIFSAAIRVHDSGPPHHQSPPQLMHLH